MVRIRREAMLGLLVAALAGCELGKTTIPLADPELVVHAILNPTFQTQTILLEESLTGKATTDTAFDPNNPVVTGGGVPITGAVVEITAPNGTVYTFAERKIGGASTGIYAGQMQVDPGSRYDLRITALGKTLTGSTLVPISHPPVGTPLVPFNRDHQAVNLPITDVSLARAYWVRIEAPVAAFSVFTTDREVAISGEVRNVYTDDLLRVFFPGFQQAMTVAAVDTNLFDYYRSGNDPFSGTGLITHLQGGLGLFGSIAIVERRVLAVTKDSTESIEGTYTARPAMGGVPHTLTLYVESKGSTDQAGDRISGEYQIGPKIALTRGPMLGTRIHGDSLDLALYAPGSTNTTNGGLAAHIRGDTLFAFVNQAGPTSSIATAVTYVRIGK